MSKRKNNKLKVILEHHIPARARDSWGGDYVDGHFDKNGKQVSRALTEDEKAWLYNFNNGYCLNNHRDEGSVFQELDDYDTRVKQELDLQNNKRNRDIQFASKLKKEEEIKFANQTLLDESIYQRDQWQEAIVIYGFSTACDMLIAHYDEQLQQVECENARAQLMLSFGIQLHKYIQEEKSQTRKLQKRKK